MNLKQIEADYRAGNLGYIDTIQALQDIGFSARDAEDTVCEWEEEVYA